MKYKTLFIDAPTLKKKGTFGVSYEEVNGDQLCRDVDAALMEMASNGYELVQSVNVNSPKMLATGYVSTPTSGILMTFKKMD